MGMTTSPCPVYLFRSAGFAPSGNTVVSVAPLDCVVAVTVTEVSLARVACLPPLAGRQSSRTMRPGITSSACGEHATPRVSARSFGLICGLRFTRKRQTRGFLSGERRKSALSLCANEGQPDFWLRQRQQAGKRHPRLQPANDPERSCLALAATERRRRSASTRYSADCSCAVTTIQLRSRCDMWGA